MFNQGKFDNLSHKSCWKHTKKELLADISFMTLKPVK